VKREAERLIEILTGWILTAFSAFAPKWELAKMGTAWMGRLFRLFDSLPLDKFSPTSEISSPFFRDIRHTSSRPSALHTATETPFILPPKHPSYCNRNALHSATETHFLFLQKCTMNPMPFTSAKIKKGRISRQAAKLAKQMSLKPLAPWRGTRGPLLYADMN
jgi:hypothetical protein